MMRICRERNEFSEFPREYLERGFSTISLDAPPLFKMVEHLCFSRFLNSFAHSAQVQRWTSEVPMLIHHAVVLPPIVIGHNLPRIIEEIPESIENCILISSSAGTHNLHGTEMTSTLDFQISAGVSVYKNRAPRPYYYRHYHFCTVRKVLKENDSTPRLWLERREHCDGFKLLTSSNRQDSAASRSRRHV